VIDQDHSRRGFFAFMAAVSAAHAIPAQAAEGTSSSSAPQAPPKAPTLATGGIDQATIAHAEQLAGISFTREERAVMAETIGEQIAMLQARQDTIVLGESLFPATTFNPLLPGRTPRPTTNTGNPNELIPVRHAVPGDATELAFASIAELSHWLRTRAITSQTLTRLSLDRLKQHGPTLHCVISLMEEQAMIQAKQADTELDAGRWRGPLHGIPWGAKDLFDTKDAPTTWGAATHRNRQPTSNAVVIDRLEQAGAVLVAKLSLGALAYGDIWFGGRTNNPWNTEDGSSGSSAGSAAATAAGLVGFALGTETCGSIVSPSMRCGATGLRPTFGRVPRDGAMALCWSLDKVGAIVRHAADAAPVLDAINGASLGDPASVTQPFHANAGVGVRGLRIGYDPTWFSDDDTGKMEQHALEELQAAGCILKKITLPDWPWSTLFTILFAEAAAAFESLTRSDFDDLLTWQAPEAWPNTFRQSWFIPAPELVQADRFRRLCMEHFSVLFDDLDAMLGPSYAEGLLITTNCTGHPSLTVPIGLKDDGNPHAVTLIGRLFDEGTLIRLGTSIESACWPVAQRRPPLG
jgi:Asp-tRNA(Asn)/Glu-tRNA(Gln) amidotransferase A subunit family amidase